MEQLQPVPKKGGNQKSLMKQILFICIGAILMAVGIEIFLVLNSIMDDGIVGI